jgi:hypothetical protein
MHLREIIIHVIIKSYDQYSDKVPSMVTRLVQEETTAPLPKLQYTPALGNRGRFTGAPVGGYTQAVLIRRRGRSIKCDTKYLSFYGVQTVKPICQITLRVVGNIDSYLTIFSPSICPISLAAAALAMSENSQWPDLAYSSRWL